MLLNEYFVGHSTVADDINDASNYWKSELSLPFMADLYVRPPRSTFSLYNSRRCPKREQNI